MDNLLTIALEAHHEDRNHHRSYRVTIGRDMLGDWTVCISYGRIGEGEQKKRFGDSEANTMKKIVRHHLRRRISAPRRIGCAYRIAEVSASSGFDIAAWLPGEIIASFIRTEPAPTICVRSLQDTAVEPFGLFKLM